MSYSKQDTHRFFFTSSRIYYPIRPIISLCFGISLICLLFVPGFPLSLAVFLGVLTLSDDLVFFPFLRVINAWRNLVNHRKVVKAVASVIGILLGLAIGALFAYFILLNIPAILGLTAMVNGALDCSIVVFLASCTIFAGLFYLCKLPTLAGAWIGSFAALAIPFGPTTAVDLIVGSALIGGFLAAFLGKHLLRFIYKIKDGHTNADGYLYQFEEKNPNALEHDKKVADLLKIGQEKVTRLRMAVLKVIENIKKNDSWFNSVARLRQLKTNSFKDILHLLITVETKEDAEKLQQLLQFGDLKNFDNQLIEHQVATDTKLNLEMYNAPASWDSDYIKINYPYTYLSWGITKRYGLTSYYTDKDAYFMYNLTSHVKGRVAGLQLCEPEIQQEFSEAMEPVINSSNLMACSA